MFEILSSRTQILKYFIYARDKTGILILVVYKSIFFVIIFAVKIQLGLVENGFLKAQWKMKNELVIYGLGHPKKSRVKNLSSHTIL